MNNIHVCFDSSGRMYLYIDHYIYCDLCYRKEIYERLIDINITIHDKDYNADVVPGSHFLIIKKKYNSDIFTGTRYSRDTFLDMFMGPSVYLSNGYSNGK